MNELSQKMKQFIGTRKQIIVQKIAKSY